MLWKNLMFSFKLIVNLSSTTKNCAEKNPRGLEKKTQFPVRVPGIFGSNT